MIKTTNKYVVPIENRGCSVCYRVTAIFKKYMKYARLKIRPRKVMSGKLNKKKL